MRRLVSASILSVVVAAGCGGEEAGSYRSGDSMAPDGTGRFYMDREIADVLQDEHLQPGADRPSRDVRELPGRLIAALELGPADRIADVGAGTGYYSLRLAEQVPHGRVFAIDLQPALLDSIEVQARARGFRNIRPVIGTEQSVNLDPESVDVALVVVSYHEFSHPREMLRSIYTALRPGGRLVMVEYRGEDTTIPVQALHRMTEAQARREVEAAGFRFIENRDALPQQHVLVFQKPLQG